MPWVLIPGALRRLRNAAKLSWEEVARATGLRVHSVRLHESKKAPRCLRLGTVKAYEKVYKSNRAEFVKWEDYGVAREDDDPMLPAAGTLQLRAEQEQQLGGAGELTVGDERVELLGARTIRRINTHCEMYQNQRFGWYGRITQQDYVPEIAAKALGARVGSASMFRVERKIEKDAPIYITAITTDTEHARYMMDCSDEKKRATVIVRVFYKPPEGDWKGFFPFEKPRRPRPFCYLVEKIGT